MTRFQNCINQNQQFTHDGCNDGHLGFARFAQALGETTQMRIMLLGGQSWKIERFTQGSAALFGQPTASHLVTGLLLSWTQTRISDQLISRTIARQIGQFSQNLESTGYPNPNNRGQEVALALQTSIFIPLFLQF